jgi:putative transposase
MIRIQLDGATRNELQALRRQALPAKVRDRLEMVLLSDAGWSVPRIAGHLGCHYLTARAALWAFLRRGQAALWPAKPGPTPDASRRRQVTDALRQLLEQERTWTSRQLSDALRGAGIVLGPRQVRRYLKVLEAGYRRTASTVAHKQDPAKVERAKVVLGGLKKKRAPAA